MFHVNPLPNRGFTQNIKFYILRKTMKIYSRLSSAAVMTDALGVKEMAAIFKYLGKLVAVVVVALLFYVHGKHLRSCRDGQLT